MLCVTRPDRRRGRGSAVTPSPVKAAALELGLAVSHSMEDVADAGVELAVVVAYGRIIPASLLARVPMVNLHFSLLPRWRGAAPVERALLAGDDETGVCLMKVEEGLDTGPVYGRLVVPIGPDEDLATLRDELVTAGCALLVAALADGAAGLPVPVPQSGEATIAPKVTPDDLRLAWEEPAAQLHRVVRLGRAWTTFRGRCEACSGLSAASGWACSALRRLRRQSRPGRRARWSEPSCAPVPAASRSTRCSRRAGRPCRPVTGPGVCALWPVSVWAATRHTHGDRDSD